MNALFSFSLLLAAGVCVGFAIHAGTLVRSTNERRYAHLLALSLLEAIYCVVAHEYLRRTNPEEALPWGQSICVFTPFITYFFGQLTLDLSATRPAWLVSFQRVNLALTSLFSAAVLVDMFFCTSLALEPRLYTNLASAHRIGWRSRLSAWATSCG